MTPEDRESRIHTAGLRAMQAEANKIDGKGLSMSQEIDEAAVERVARAICLTYCADPDRLDHWGGSATPIAAWETCIPEARAAIEAYGVSLSAQREQALEEAYYEGWHAAAGWAGRDDLYSDAGSPAYDAEMNKRLDALRAKQS